jgi:hypothetical protein
MPIMIYKVADIIDWEIVFSPFAKKTVPDAVRVEGVPARTFGDVAGLALFELGAPVYPHILRPRPRPRSHLSVLNKYLSKSSYSGVNPVFIPEDKSTQLVYFRDRLFMSERLPRLSERAEVVLRVKKAVYDEEAELSTLRAAVANIEAAIEFQKSGPKRNPIPEDVKLLVWARDGGHCVRCGSEQELHFDHIIPVAKGGGNIAANIQILCQTCNLKKSDRIAMPYSFFRQTC